MSKRMNIAIAINKKFIPYAYVMLTSLFENNKSEELVIYILHNNILDGSLDVFYRLGKQYQQEINLVAVDDSIIPKDLHHSDKWPIEVYYRFVMPFELPLDEDRILYLDTDIIINQSIREMYFIDFNGKSFAGCADVSNGNLSDIQNKLFSEIYLKYPGVPQEQIFTYINAGVMLVNVEKLRNNYSLKYFIDKASELKDILSANDQDLVNYLFYNDILVLDGEKYNYSARIHFNSGMGYDYVKEHKVAIVHFMGPKPWSVGNLRTDVEKIFWDYARKTPYYSKLIEDTLMGEIEKSYTNTNEFWYISHQKQQLEEENARLSKMNRELLEVMEQSRQLIERLSK